jgi:hypothetical protein
VLQGLGKDEVLMVYADSRAHEDGVIVNEIALAGRPLTFMPVVIGPEPLLDESYTEFAAERASTDFDWNRAPGTALDAVPDAWHVAVGDDELVVYANDLDERDGEHLFTLRVRGGGPPLPVARVSSSLVTGLRREQLGEADGRRAEPSGGRPRIDPDAEET